MNAKDKLAAKAAVKAKAQKDALEFFHDAQYVTYATVPVLSKGAHRETWRIECEMFSVWVARTLFEHLKFPPPEFLVKEIIKEFKMFAICDGPMLDVSVRVAGDGNTTYLDLANDRWQAIEISEQGWRTVNEPAVKFRRSVGMASLPHPVSDGDPQEIISFLNVRTESEILLLTWLSYSFRPRGPYPILALSGVQGSGKSTVTKVLRALVDPSLAELSDTPHDERSLVMAASNAHLLAFDNLSEIKPAMSDALCRVATGGAHRERKYYTNDGSEVLFTFQNPVIINGISELPERPDLLDRSIVVHMEPITEVHRRDERTFWKDFDAARPRMVGAMLDAVCSGIRNVDTVDLPFTPRMADFARWGVAVEQSLGFEPGTFLAAYQRNLADANAAALESSPIAWTVYQFLQEQPDKVWCGTFLRLLQTITEFVEMREVRGPQSLVRKQPRWPKSANALSAEIARVEPNLRKLGIEVERYRTKAARYIRLTVGDNVDEVSEETVTAQTIPEQEVAAG
jgi:hypothetical protein